MEAFFVFKYVLRNEINIINRKKFFVEKYTGFYLKFFKKKIRIKASKNKKTEPNEN